MRIELKKFGNILTSREAGREALLAFLPTLKSLGEHEEIIIDFQGVSVLTPSWADEFIRPILFLKRFTEKVTVIHDTNPSVQAALRFANPNLDYSKIRVYEDKILFDEKTDNKIDTASTPLTTLIFPLSDEDTLRILTINKIKAILIKPAEFLKGDSRLNAVIKMLNKAGIETTINKQRLV